MQFISWGHTVAPLILTINDVGPLLLGLVHSPLQELVCSPIVALRIVLVVNDQLLMCARNYISDLIPK